MSSSSSIIVAVLVAMICLSSQALAYSGTATYYTPPYVPSACNGFDNDGTMIAAASDEIWDNGKVCGTVYTVTCVGRTNLGVLDPCKEGSVTVKIVDRCPSPVCQGTIDLSQEAFAKISDPAAAKIEITYE